MDGRFCSRQTPRQFRTKPIEALAADLPAAPVNFVANALNQYSTIKNQQSAIVNPVHDSDGNLQLDAGINKDGQTREYIWDGENRLIAVKRTDTGATLVTYQYDHHSRLISRSADGTTTRYLYQGWNRIAEYRQTGTGHDLEKSYLWGMDMSGTIQGAGGVGGLLMVSEISNSQISNYHPTYDGNGNVSEYLDSTVAAVAHYEYDPFGRTIVAIGSKAQDFAHRFSSKPLDEVSGWYYYGYRFYDPVTGRWPSRDPIEEEGGINLYGFVGNDGINWIDVWGLKGRVICTRCKDNPNGKMICIIVKDGKKGKPFPSNEGENDPILPPGTYDLLPKPDSQMDEENRNLPDDHPRDKNGKVNGKGGTPEYPRGTPSITHPSKHKNPGQARPNKPHLNNHRVHGPGDSNGCMACSKAPEIKKLMDEEADDGGTTYEIVEVDCPGGCDPSNPKTE